jgi:Zn ribbon nucleic-acid-binding protein
MSGIYVLGQVENPPIHTGVVCPACKRPVGLIERREPQGTFYECSSCGHRWTDEPPQTP